MELEGVNTNINIIDDVYNGEMVIVQADPQVIKLLDLTNTDNPEILGVYGHTESRIAVAAKRITNY
jgi:hypothetical protein